MNRNTSEGIRDGFWAFLWLIKTVCARCIFLRPGGISSNRRYTSRGPVGLAVISLILVSPLIHAQAMTDVVTVTIAASGIAAEGAGFYAATSLGTAAPKLTSNGYEYYRLTSTDGTGPSCTKKCVAASSTFAISGLTASPGQAWLTSITPPAAQKLYVNGVAQSGNVLSGASATFTYSAGTATWVWGGAYYPFTAGTAEVFSIVHNAPPLGYLDLKYQIVAVDYAPPGAKSSVNYGASAMRGTATMDTATYKNTVSTSISGDIGLNIFGLASGGLTETTTASWSQQSGNTSSLTLATTTSNSDIVYGPLSSTDGIDHDYDVIWVWLNPIAAVYAGVNSVSLAGYAFNLSDPAQTMDVQPIYVLYLKTPSLMPAALKQILARTWDTTGLGGLTETDYAAILTADPFVSSTYNPNTDTTHRFGQVGTSTIPYEPPPAGGQPITVQGSIATQATTAVGQNSQSSYSVGFELDFTSNVTFIAQFASSVKISDTWVTTDTWSSTINTQTGKTATYSVTGPAYADNYAGPEEFQVWRDNIYGSFMFYPIN